MNNANNLPSMPGPAPVVQQQQQQSPSVLNSTPVTLSNLSPTTIVRAVFLPPGSDQTIQSRPFTSNPGPTYVFPTHQLHQYGGQCVDVAGSTVGLLPTDPSSNSNFTTALGPSTQQKRQKGQPKQPQQPQQPRQSKSAKKSSKRQPEQNGQQSAAQQQKPSGSQQHSTQSGVKLTKKQQEKEDYYNRKYQLLRKCVRSLVFKNAALCDEVARLHQRIATVDAERKTILKRLLHHERLKQRRQQAAEHKRAQQEAAAAEAAAATPTVCTAMSDAFGSSPIVTIS